MTLPELFRVSIGRLADRGACGVVVRDSLPRVCRQAPIATGCYTALSLDCAVRRAARASRAGTACLWCRCIRSRPCPAHPIGIGPDAALAAQSPRAGAAVSPPTKTTGEWRNSRGTPQRPGYLAVPFPIFSSLQAAI